MGAEVVPFPPRTGPLCARPLRFPPPQTRRYGLGDMARALALEPLERRTQIDRLRALARLDGLPLPVNSRIRAGRVLRGPVSICAASQWDAAAVDAWLHRPDPSAPAMPDAPPVPLGTYAEMAARAARLAGGR